MSWQAAEKRLTSEQLKSKLHAQKVMRLEEDLKAKQKEMQEAEENSDAFQQAPRRAAHAPSPSDSSRPSGSSRVMVSRCGVRIGC